MKFTTNTPASHWAGFQVIQGVAAGFGMQMSSLVVQQALKDNHDLVPIGIALVTFLQYLGSSVAQVISGAIFNENLRRQLASVGLSPAQTGLLLQAGTRSVRETVQNNFPDKLSAVLEAYNWAITQAFVSSRPLVLSWMETDQNVVCAVVRCGSGIFPGLGNQVDQDRGHEVGNWQ